MKIGLFGYYAIRPKSLICNEFGTEVLEDGYRLFFFA